MYSQWKQIVHNSPAYGMYWNKGGTEIFRVANQWLVNSQTHATRTGGGDEVESMVGM